MRQALHALWAALLLGGPWTAAAGDEDFQACVAELRAQGAERGLPEDTLETAFAEVERLERVIELDRRQPEFVQTFGEYLEARLTPARVERGRALLAEHEELLEAVYRDFGVPPRYLVALWGLETNYGGYFGRVPVIDALATLACDPRRSAFFTGQLMEALTILADGHMDRDGMRGSWAGAMGHHQFMPTTFTRYAVDYDGSGTIDLWRSLPDTFASAANFLRRAGWRPGERWGREVRLPEGFDWSLADLGETRPLEAWAELGVRRADGGPLPVADMEAALVLPAGHQGPAFLVYRNTRVIMRWNHSLHYALAVGLLADRLAGGVGLHREAPVPERPLRLDDIETLQAALAELGHDPGPADGILGPQTRAAVRAFQAEHGLPADGHPDRELFETVMEAAR